ncbi:MAG: methylated-DNA--[protein]-cysteine S-methyltransferase [Clostridiales bacterium]|jgi:methylated-DNA-[protein]-cysteine S-methyltransferase|nr:methylated-DNA--[protein]-cysteine S-methyltransferase [Clostridiales bacterium]
MNYAFIYDTRIGKVKIAEDGLGITEIDLISSDEEEEANTKKADLASVVIMETDLIRKAYEELSEYLNGKRKKFTVPLNPKGTEFQQKVWKVLQTIPFGETKSYGQVAMEIDNPKACRAVGMANHRNPILIMIPCHRVIGADGSLTGYGGGLSLKEFLLDLEQEKG